MRRTIAFEAAKEYRSYATWTFAETPLGCSCAPTFWLNRDFITCPVISDCPVWLGDEFIADARLGLAAVDGLEHIFNYAAEADPEWKPTGHEILQARRDLKMLRYRLST